MRRSLFMSFAAGVFAAALLFTGPSAAGAPDGEDGALLDFVAGNYSVIGKRPAGGETYTGTVTIKRSGGRLKMLRCIGGARFAGEGSIEPVTADRIPNVMYKWSDGVKKYEGRYEIHSDIDNYARLSGPYARTGADRTRWGWELLYVDGDDVQECK